MVGLNRIMVIFEILAVLGAAVLAVLWMNEPDGPYEPFTYTLALIGIAIDLLRRCISDRNNIIDIVPSDILSKLELGCPKERVQDILGLPVKTLDGMWLYRFRNALIQIEFDSSFSTQSVILANTIYTSKKGFDLIWFDECLGDITFGHVDESLEGLQHRSSMRTAEIYLQTVIGPPGAVVNWSFGALKPLTPGILADVDIPDIEQHFRKDGSANIRINWVGYSIHSDELFFEWSLAIESV